MRLSKETGDTSTITIEFHVTFFKKEFEEIAETQRGMGIRLKSS